MFQLMLPPSRTVVQCSQSNFTHPRQEMFLRFPQQAFLSSTVSTSFLAFLSIFFVHCQYLGMVNSIVNNSPKGWDYG